MSLYDRFTEAVDTIRDLQFHATKTDNDKSFSFYSNQIFNLTLVGLITLRLFFATTIGYLGVAHSLPTHFPANVTCFIAPKESVQSFSQLSTVPNLDSLLTPSMLKCAHILINFDVTTFQR